MDFLQNQKNIEELAKEDGPNSFVKINGYEDVTSDDIEESKMKSADGRKNVSKDGRRIKSIDVRRSFDGRRKMDKSFSMRKGVMTSVDKKQINPRRRGSSAKRLPVQPMLTREDLPVQPMPKKEEVTPPEPTPGRSNRHPSESQSNHPPSTATPKTSNIKDNSAKNEVSCKKGSADVVEEDEDKCCCVIS